MNRQVFTQTQPRVYQCGLGRPKPVVPQPPADLSVYCVCHTNPPMFCVCCTVEKGGNTAFWEERHWAMLFQSKAKGSGRELVRFHGGVVESSVNSEMRKMGLEKQMQRDGGIWDSA